jgi:hypothetical protein
MLGPVVFNQARHKSKKIQIIGIQFRPGLNEQNKIEMGQDYFWT